MMYTESGLKPVTGRRNTQAELGLNLNIQPGISIFPGIGAKPKTPKISRQEEVKNIVEQASLYVLGLSIKELSVARVRDVAEHFDINASFLSRKFKNHYRCNLCEFIQGEKIRRAILILQREKKLSINRLSRRLGFSSTEYFIRVFKKNVGITPHKYRKYGNMN